MTHQAAHLVQQPVVTARGLTRRFGTLTALRDVTFDIPGGSICGLIGPNGAGKTTLLRILSGLDEPDQGERALDGVDVAVNPGEARGRFGYVPDYAGLYDALSVREVVSFFAAAHGVPAPRVVEATDRALAAAGLAAVADRNAASLSKGMTQRACVACALVHDPAVLFLDEPAAGLDPRARIELRELLKGLRLAGKTIVISSHILSELSDMVDRVLILERGVLKASGPITAAWQSAVAVGGPVQARARLEVTSEPERAEELLRTHPLVREVVRRENVMEVTLAEGDGLHGGLPQVGVLVRALVEAGVDVGAAIPHRPDLESLFLTVTKGELQ
jgi:ABC-2 type transport system ATP-binding protein